MNGIKRKPYRIPTTFGPDTQFQVAPLMAAWARGPVETELDRLKARLLEPHLDKANHLPSLQAGLKGVGNEAASLAWTTPFPLLVLPILLEEMVFTLERRSAIQQKIRGPRPNVSEAP